TPRPDREVVFEGISSKDPQVDAAILGVVEDDLSRITPLGNMMGNPYCDNTADSWHRDVEVGHAVATSPKNRETRCLLPGFSKNRETWCLLPGFERLGRVYLRSSERWQ